VDYLDALVESWNGTSWTEVNDLNTARGFICNGAGTATAALATGGNPVTAVTESWNGTSWTEVNDLNTAVVSNGMRGTQTSALNFGGSDGTAGVANTESWNGTSWSNVNNMNIIKQGPGSSGSSNSSALAFGGAQPTGSPADVGTEEWSGPAVQTVTITVS
jgi:hypothetical protein